MRKILTLMAGSAAFITAAFASENYYPTNDFLGSKTLSPQKTYTSENKKFNSQKPELEIFTAQVRIKYFLDENPEEAIRKELEQKLTNCSKEAIESALDCINTTLQQDKNLVTERGLQLGVAGIFEKINSVLNNYLSKNSNQESYYHQKAQVLKAFTLPKIEKGLTNENRLGLFQNIAENNQFPQKWQNFARYAIVEQKTKHSVTDPTNPPYKYDSKMASRDYNLILKKEAVSKKTRISIQYHLAELDYLDLKNNPENRDSVRKSFEAIEKDENAYPFTRKLARVYLNKLNMQ